MVFAAIVVIIAAGALLCGFTPDPFTWRFDFGILTLLFGLWALPAWFARGLVRRHAGLPRFAGWTVAFLLGAAAVLSAVMVIDYRTLVFRRASADAWRSDLAWLDTRLDGLPARLRARAYEVTRPALAKFIAESDRLAEDVRHVKLAAVLATLDDGHSLYFPFFPASSLGLVPLQVRFFAEGLFVTAAGGEHRALAGGRVERIAGMPPEEAYRRIAPYVAADNDESRCDRAPLYMLSPRFWRALGVGSGESLDLVVSQGGGPPVKLASVNRLKYLWWWARPMVSNRAPWRVEARPDRSALVVRFTRVAQVRGETLAEFGVRLVNDARHRAVKRVVIDVRENAGGDNTLLPAFVEALRASEFNRQDGLYVLIGPATFSAATNFVSLMEAKTKATLVGSPTGSGPNHHGDSDHVVLPRTRAVVFLSTRWHQFGAPDDTRRSHRPHVHVPDSASDYFSGRDGVLEAALGPPTGTVTR